MAGKIRSGSLDRRVTLLRQGPADHDGYQRVPGAWNALASRSASLKPAKGAERFEIEGEIARAVMVLWLRRDSVTRTLTASDAVAIDGERFVIIAPPVEIGNREGVELHLVGSGESWEPAP